MLSEVGKVLEQTIILLDVLSNLSKAKLFLEKKHNMINSWHSHILKYFNVKHKRNAIFLLDNIFLLNFLKFLKFLTYKNSLYLQLIVFLIINYEQIVRFKL